MCLGFLPWNRRRESASTLPRDSGPRTRHPSRPSPVPSCAPGFGPPGPGPLSPVRSSPGNDQKLTQRRVQRTAHPVVVCREAGEVLTGKRHVAMWLPRPLTSLLCAGDPQASGRLIGEPALPPADSLARAGPGPAPTAPEETTTGGPSNTPGLDPHTREVQGPAEAARPPTQAPAPGRFFTQQHTGAQLSAAGGRSGRSLGRVPACATGRVSRPRVDGTAATLIQAAHSRVLPPRNPSPTTWQRKNAEGSRVCAAGPTEQASPHTDCCALVKNGDKRFLSPQGLISGTQPRLPVKSGCKRRTAKPRSNVRLDSDRAYGHLRA